MKKLLILLSIAIIAFAQFETTEQLYLDIYSDFTADIPMHNPAYLSVETAPYNYAFSYSWLETGGEYKLPYDPEKKSYHNLQVSAYQEMENGLIFGGRFAYRNEKRLGKLWLHNAETNINIPFYFGDSTKGDFNLNGIDWNIVLSYPLGQDIRIAMDIFYNVDEQFKSVFPKPNSKRNNLHVRPAISYKSDNLRLGITSSIFNYKEEIKTKQYSLEQNKTPIFMRIRGLDRALLSYAETSEERLQNINGYSASADILLYNLVSVQAAIEDAGAEITDGGSDPVNMGSWDMMRYYYRTDLLIDASRHVRINPSFSQSWESANGYHPELNNTIYKYNYRRFEGNLDIAFTPIKNETFAVIGGYRFEDIKREDNFFGLAHYIPSTTLIVGTHYRMDFKDKSLTINLDYEQKNVISSTEYSSLAGKYYEIITENEIDYYATDTEKIIAGIKFSFPINKTVLALYGNYEDIRAMNSDIRFHGANVKIELIY